VVNRGRCCWGRDEVTSRFIAPQYLFYEALRSALVAREDCPTTKRGGNLHDSQTWVPQPKQFYPTRNIKCCISDFHIDYPASMSQKDFFSIWAREAEAALGAKKAGGVIDIWKCVGSRRVVAVSKVDSPDTLDQILLDLPIMKELGQHVQVDVTALRRLEDFATDLKKRLE
jgi:muconolactone delta-isomerase